MDRYTRIRWRSGIVRYKRFVGQIAVVGLIALYLAYLAFFQIDQTQSASAQTDSLSPVRYHMVASMATAKMAEGLHYHHPTINNEVSSTILDSYLTVLDPQKIYLLQSDIDEFRVNELYFDDFLIEGKLDEVFRIFERYQQRVKERMGFAAELLDYEFNFGLSDVLQNDRSEAGWSESMDDYDWLWRRLVKDDILTLTLEGYEESIKETLRSRYSRRQQNVLQYKADDVTELFLNAYLRKLDPYSAYFSSNSTEDLEISLSQQIEGIGAVLIRENEFTIVHSLITGGPAQRSNLIHKGDRIVGVLNRENEFRDVIGWRLSDVVDLIRGPKGSYVTLKVIPKDALPGSIPQEITILRDKVKIEDQMAKKSTVEIEESGRLLQLGVVTLPAFYAALYPNNNRESVRRSAIDVAKLLGQLNDQQVDGIVMDLRGNGGGALSEAVDLTSLFIESGPVVQVKSTDGELDIKFDMTGKVTYDGPLVVLVDRSSASGSEIFAGAMQDYGRGIIVGETTFGKGMLQTIWPLDKVADTENAGTLKLSTAKFYRVDGTSTHYFGVIPDIRFATDEFAKNAGHRSYENAQPGGSIEHADAFIEWYDAHEIRKLIPHLTSRSLERTQFNPVVEYLVQQERINQRRLDQTEIYLNRDMRVSVLDEERRTDLQTLNNLRASMGWSAAAELNEDTVPTELIEDTFLNEALNVLADLIVYQD